MAQTRSQAVKAAQKKSRQSLFQESRSSNFSGKESSPQIEFVGQGKRKRNGGKGKRKAVPRGKVNRSRNTRKGGRSTVLTPPNRRVWLKYVSTQNLGAGAHTSFAYPLYSNGAFAPDPSSPSGFSTTPGFSVLATNYAAYRVRRYKGKITFENTTAVPADTVVCHTNSALGASSGGSSTIDILQFAANRPQFNTIIPIQASTGGPNKAVHRFKHTISSVAGESVMQPGYKSLTNTVPSILTYIVFGYAAASNLSTMAISVDLMMEVEFLDYIDTLTSFSSEKERLSLLGKPEMMKCAGCKAVEQLEYLPCPDPQCFVEDVCTNCGFSRRCSSNCQSSRCPYKEDTIKLRPPLQKKESSSKL